MARFIQRDDGQWLSGLGATAVSPEKPVIGYAGLAASMAAIARYRIVAAVYCPQRKDDQFTIFG